MIGVKILKCLYKLCNGYILPSFVNKQYFKLRKKFKKKQSKLLCSYCKRKNKKLKSCIGCMKVFYCNKKCQKLHWKMFHRNKCDDEWKQIYPMLQETILDRMNCAYF